MFSCCSLPPESKEMELGSSNQETSPAAHKKTRAVLVPCHTFKCVPTAVSGGVDIFDVPRCYLLREMCFQ